MKKVVAIIVVVAVLLSCMTITAFAKEQNSKITSALAEKLEKLPAGERVETCVWLFYQHDADLIERKTYEECGLTAGTCMTLEEVDIYSKTYNRIAGELEAANNKALIEKAGVSEEDVIFCGTMSPLVILNLTKEQIYTISTFTEVQYLDYDNTVLADDPSDPDLPYKPLSFLKGDADIDGEVTVMDATYIQRSELGIKCPTIVVVDTADVDGDGDVSIIDATLIQRHLVGIPTRFNIGEYI